MIARLFPAALRGEVTAPPSKSDAQRLLIAAWLAGDIDRVQLNGAQSADIAACVRWTRRSPAWTAGIRARCCAF